MSSTNGTFRKPLAWLKAQFGIAQGPPPGGERRAVPRKRMRFEAQIELLDGSTPAVGVDIHEDGARILSSRGWEAGSVIFLRLTEVQLGGFAEIRHCVERPDGRFSIGLAFRGPLLPQGTEWQIRRIVQVDDAWTEKDDRPYPEPVLPHQPREVA